MNELKKAIDKWCAEQCGVEWAYGHVGWIKHPTSHGVIWWTIQDPRCREIVRERLHLSTYYLDHSEWGCTESYYANDKTAIDCPGDTIAEAEIACITAIWEARDE